MSSQIKYRFFYSLLFFFHLIIMTSVYYKAYWARKQIAVIVLIKKVKKPKGDIEQSIISM